MREETVTCPRCSEAVSELSFLPPGVLTRDIIEEVKSPDQAPSDDGGMEVCADCLAELSGD